MGSVSTVLEQIGANIKEVGIVLSRNPEAFAEVAKKQGEWTAPQVADHLCQVHLGMIRAMKGSAPMPGRSLKSRVALPMMRLVMTRGIRVPAGGAEPTAAADADLRPILETLEKLQGHLSEACERADFDPRQFGFDHPFVGPLNKLETLEFVRDHLRYHIIRADRLVR